MNLGTIGELSGLVIMSICAELEISGDGNFDYAEMVGYLSSIVQANLPDGSQQQVCGGG